MTTATTAEPPRDRAVASTIALVLANLVPLIGVLALGWKVFPLIFLYWLENVVIGGFNVLKMLLADPDRPNEWLAKLGMIPVFCLQFGIYTLMLGAVVFIVFGDGAVTAPFTSPMPTPALVLATVRATGTGWTFIALMLSHGVSFVMDYLMGGEYRHAELRQLLSQPYERVVILQLAVMVGAYVVAELHSAIPALMVLVGCKISADLHAHRRERQKLRVSSKGRMMATVWGDPA